MQYVINMPAKPAHECKMNKSRDLICLGSTLHGICRGDSGGPLVCGGFIRGSASFGAATDKGCGKGTVEQYYADVEKNIGWIDTVMTNQSNSESKRKKSEEKKVLFR